MAEHAEIQRGAFEDGDRFVGTPEQLVAAGLIRSDQLPVKRSMVNYVKGLRNTSHGSIRKNEDWLQVRLLPGGLCSVIKGISAAESNRRRAARREREREEGNARLQAQAAAVRAHLAEAARTSLASIPRSGDAFRRSLVKELRWHIRFVLETMPRSAKHGYALAPDSLAAALMSVDAVVEKVMAAEVVVDHAANTALIHQCHVQIAAGAPELSQRVAGLGMPNPAILAGEVSS